MKRQLSLVSLAIMCSALCACGEAASPPQPVRPVATLGQIAISEPRLRLPPAGRDQTAAYFTLTNRGSQSDRLVSAKSSAAKSIELHTHIKSADGIMMMRELIAIDVPGNARILLAPGGLHLMVKGVRPGLKLGDVMPVTLTFATGGSVEILLPVVANPQNKIEGDNTQGKGHQHH